MLSVGRCGVARLEMKVGHMDGMHCFIDITSTLVKIKSVSLYNCQTVRPQNISNSISGKFNFFSRCNRRIRRNNYGSYVELSPRCRENMSHLKDPIIMFLENDIAFGLCLSVNVDFCCAGSVSSLTGILHKAFRDRIVVFRNGVIR